VSVQPPRVCPSCREEYLATVERCAECDVALASAGELPPEEDAGLPPVEEMAQLRVENPVWIESLAAHLAEQGIPSRVVLLDSDAPTARRHGAPCALFVVPADLERARRIDEELLRRQLPDLPEGADTGWSEAEGCPACGAAVDPQASECPDCGLAFGDEP
jgi:predicted amidophosphoribosyltransferase